MQRIIVTADDYGMCEIVDQAIDAGIQNGFISSTNVLVNMETLENAGSLRKRFPRISVGVHWNVTCGKPVCSPEEVPSLIQEDGAFYPVQVFKKLFAKGKINRNDLERELKAQYDIFHKMCGNADYWNTHENSALGFKVFKVFANVAREYGIPATRTFERVYYDKVNFTLKESVRELVVKNVFDFWFARIRKQFKMPTARVVSFNRISKTEGDVLLNALLNDGRDLIEVVFHPATSSIHPAFGCISSERVKEYEFVSSPSTLKKFTSKGLAIASFSDV